MELFRPWQSSTNLHDEDDLDDNDYNNPPTLKLADDVFERDDSEDEEDKEDSDEQNVLLRTQFKMDTSKKIGKKIKSNASKPDKNKTIRKLVVRRFGPMKSLKILWM